MSEERTVYETTDMSPTAAPQYSASEAEPSIAFDMSGEQSTCPPPSHLSGADAHSPMQDIQCDHVYAWSDFMVGVTQPDIPRINVIQPTPSSSQSTSSWHQTHFPSELGPGQAPLSYPLAQTNTKSEPSVLVTPPSTPEHTPRSFSVVHGPLPDTTLQFTPRPYNEYLALISGISGICDVGSDDSQYGEQAVSTPSHGLPLASPSPRNQASLHMMLGALVLPRTNESTSMIK
jgi:hypothetical protein